MDLKPIAAIAVFVGWIALGWYNGDVALLLVSLPMLLFGLVGVARRRITARGKVGPARTYTGLAAVHVGLFFVTISTILCVFAVHDLWRSFAPW